MISSAVERSVAGCKIQFFSVYFKTNQCYCSNRSPAVVSRSLAVLFEIENPEKLCIVLVKPIAGMVLLFLRHSCMLN